VVVAAIGVRGLNMKWFDDQLVRGLEKEAIRLAAGLEVVRRNGDEAAVAKIESLLTKVLGLLDEADEARAVSVAPPL
jgi:hypothetical protein